MTADTTGLDAGDAVVRALRAISERLDELEPAALRDEPDAVHQMRTHVRRLRSVLAAFAPLFDSAVAEALRRRYGEFGRELGTVRDLEVRIGMAERAVEELSEQGREEIADVDAIRVRLIDDEVESHRLAHARFVQLQRLPRAAARRRDLAEFLADAPRTPGADEPAGSTLGDLLDREARRTTRRASRVDESAGAERLHAVRKAGRRLRYAAEALTEEPVVLFGKRARTLARAGEELHDVLGDHRDEVLFAEHVRRVAAHAAHAGAPVDALERIAIDADRRAAERLSQLDAVVRELRRANRKWVASR
ncbi:CHAD domain-containing protein [Agromyces ramosus]|uniref:CHAD domain-containing protein n=1 Tax=Agromyces ramosus TaxID=33879 RepID=A0A4Q7MEH2_9MICO|nr:CHAD domain-containing protein [Agromyces ramosus]RZS66635.1 CHAD domain-containing protein [Agromyces ramosus]